MESDFNIFKIGYTWYEGDYGEALLGKKVSTQDFEKDIIEAKNFAKNLIGNEIDGGDYLGKGYAVECLPEYFEQIIWFLEKKKGYIQCYLDEEYDVNDDSDRKIVISRKVEKTEWKDIELKIEDDREQNPNDGQSNES